MSTCTSPLPILSVSMYDKYYHINITGKVLWYVEKFHESNLPVLYSCEDIVNICVITKISTLKLS